MSRTSKSVEWGTCRVNLTGIDESWSLLSNYFIQYLDKIYTILYNAYITVKRERIATQEFMAKEGENDFQKWER